MLGLGNLSDLEGERSILERGGAPREHTAPAPHGLFRLRQVLSGHRRVSRRLVLRHGPLDPRLVVKSTAPRTASISAFTRLLCA